MLVNFFFKLATELLVALNFNNYYLDEFGFERDENLDIAF